MKVDLLNARQAAMAVSLLLALTYHTAWSQQVISGKVADEAGEGIPGVNVIVENTTTGTTTDADGAYNLAVNSVDAVLVFSFIGYRTERVPVGGQSIINLSMSADLQALEEVVVVGYGTQRKRDVTGAISSVTSENILERVPVDVYDALQGQAPGLQITAESARPGAGSTVRIRGTATIQGGANPLYVIDGVLAENPDGVNPNDIQSIEILRDAASTSIYGVQGANGVIIITTKRGVEGKPKFDVSYLRTYSSIANKLPQANADERRLFDFIRSDNPSTTVNPDSLNPSVNADNDHQDLILQTAVRNQLDLSFSGASKNMNYYTSLGYLDEEGVVVNSWAKTLRTRINLDYKNGRFSAGNRLQFFYRKENRIHEDRVLIQALQRPPVFRVFLADGTLAPTIGGRRNPLAWALLRRNEYDIYDGSIYNYLAYEIAKGLKLTTDFQVRLNYAHNNFFEPRLIQGNNNSGGDRVDVDFSWLSQTYLNYNKSLGDHNVTGVLGMSFQKDVDSWSRIQGRSYLSEKIPTTNAIQEIDLAASRTDESRSTTASFFARVGYDFKGKYIFNANIRRDGSSRFGIDNRWGVFPGVSAGWRFSDEPFMSWTRSVLDDGKIRVSYGQTGNNRIGNYDAIRRYEFGSNFYNGVSGAAPATTFGNNTLSWETTSQFNTGMDLALLGGRVNVVVDYYKKITDDLLYDAPLPVETGFEDVTINVGSIENEGVELGINGYIIDKPALRWQGFFNITFNNDKVRTLAGGLPFTPANKWYVEEGGRLGNFYGWKNLGVYAFDESNAYADNGELLTLVTDAEGNISTDGNGDPVYLLNGQAYAGNVNQLTSNGQPMLGGDVIWEDLNKDGEIDDTDRQILGNAQPKFYLGLGNIITYKSFSLSFNFYVNWGNKIYDEARRDTYVMSPTNVTPQPYFIHNAWTQQGDVTDVHIARNKPQNLREVSSYFVEDGSYVRLRNVKLSYRLDPGIASKLHLKGLSAYVYGSNLLTWTNYKWYDPEINMGNPLEMGRDAGAYPKKREYGIGINVNL